MWNCVCECGTEKAIPGSSLRNGSIVSCGCYKREQIAKSLASNKINGGNRQKDNRYKRYYAMLGRCSERALGKGKKNYKDLGIEVCERWKESFDNFCEDMGECPKGFELDRIDNSKGYSPDNCRWIDRNTNQFNKNISRKNTSGRTGVSKLGSRWRAYITVERKQISLGIFHEYQDAVKARTEGEIKYYGFCLNQ